MPNPISADPPKYYITEPLLCSFKPQKREDGSIRMAFIKAGQKAYSTFGDEATLTEEFISRDYKTWEGGLVSINHQYNNEWVKAIMRDIEYDPKDQIGICSFYELPDWLTSLIYSDDYRGLSQECIPIEFKKNSSDVVKGYGTGCTIVTDPYEPAATQGMGVGIRPELAAILASKYPQKDDYMVDKTGGGTPAVVSVEAFESTVSENVTLKSTIKTLESDNKRKDEEIASWEKKYKELESGEADRTKIAVSEARKSWETELKATAERENAISELNSVMSKEAAESYLATNPTVDQIKSIAGIMKASASKSVGSSTSHGDQEEGKSFEELNSAWNAKLGRA